METIMEFTSVLNDAGSTLRTLRPMIVKLGHKDLAIPHSTHIKLLGLRILELLQILIEGSKAGNVASVPLDDLVQCLDMYAAKNARLNNAYPRLADTQVDEQAKASMAETVIIHDMLRHLFSIGIDAKATIVSTCEALRVNINKSIIARESSPDKLGLLHRTLRAVITFIRPSQLQDFNNVLRMEQDYQQGKHHRWRSVVSSWTVRKIRHSKIFTKTCCPRCRTTRIR